MATAQISADCPIMCFLIFELLTEAGEKLIRRVVLISRGVFRLRELSCLRIFSNFEIRNHFPGERTAGGNGENRAESFSDFRGVRGVQGWCRGVAIGMCWGGGIPRIENENMTHRCKLL